MNALPVFLTMALAVGAARAEPQPLAAYMALPEHAPSARIAYGPGPSQVVELFLPKGKGPHPVVILLHGGCWRREYEGLKQTSGIAADLASRGLAVWNVEYRGVDEAGGGYPGTFQDVATAVDLIRTDAAKYNLDTRRLVAVGHSAGAHLALWAAARPRLPAGSVLKSADPLPIRTVISLGGVGDLKAQEAVSKMVCGYDRDILLGVRPDPFADTSPAELLPTGTKVVMVHGVYDHVFPPYTGRAYAEKVAAASDPVEVVIIPDAGHFDTVMTGTPAWNIVSARIVAEIKAPP
jgi:acetyl esterase/lipase